MRPAVATRRRWRAWVCLSLALLAPSAAQAATIYLCKAYSGGTFWADVHCNRHQAHIERMFSVPDGMPFDQKVALGQQALAALRRPAEPQAPSIAAGIHGSPVPGSERECEALLERIKALDSMRHEVRPAIPREQIAQRKHWAQARRSQLRCR